MPNPWDRPDEYEALVENMTPPMPKFKFTTRVVHSPEELERIRVEEKEDKVINQD